ncbi:bifunctional diaminohydroxyphosphoribosylaminopyrimidine deaminase/5-amino-6-(5-phosphoribosylamino)uracil reductase RibD [uncultured Bacteroides sp.]|uniref:bifunctional diaminohydroxyphosphoribosylaminopyrimidine deaminase/5-amino-6-(5-phosphoribosylamino)uracil reductase RibD n=1 Tax=uncultured Bacteroides sp. TaxID=162156 RepID=UPI002AA5F91E|nr:bifunctional diaminohydroxyphosphoribosylaminopyrimidine deaminase/5-amino-6-(5-phosphoribosylamino)uracil reductase RibD [uncultured Bacteroides sp.]
MENNGKITQEERYMARCIQLAKQGKCGTSPNPMVGAVIVCDGKIIGEGYHRKCGESHAEVNAINSVKDKSKLKQSTIYVSLEPCSHYGKTPPCADLIIQKGIPKVVIGCMDPFAKVAGRGIKKLQDAGIEVTVGVLEQECCELNKQFITFHSQNRPYVILKWAESADGFIDLTRTGGHPVILSSPLTNMLVHKKRAEIDAVIVGTRTALLDNPVLNVRNWYGRNPLRVVIDRTLKIPEDFHLLNNKISTWVITEKEHQDNSQTKYKIMQFTDELLPQILAELHKNNVQSVLVEGGSVLLQSFINKDLWDEAFIEKTTIKLNSGVKAPFISGNDYSIKTHFSTPIWHYFNENDASILL